MSQQHDAPEDGAECPFCGTTLGKGDRACPNFEQAMSCSWLSSDDRARLILARAPTPPAPSGLVDAVRAFLAAVDKVAECTESTVATDTGVFRKAEELADRTRATLDATLSGQQGGAVPAGDLDAAYDRGVFDGSAAKSALVNGLSEADRLLTAEVADAYADAAKRGTAKSYAQHAQAQRDCQIIRYALERARLAEQPALAGADDVFPRGAGVGTYFRRLPDNSWIMLNSSDQWVTVPNYIPAPAGTGDADRAEGLRPGLEKALEIVKATYRSGEAPDAWHRRVEIQKALRAALDAGSRKEGRA